MRAVISVWGRFHLFHLARRLLRAESLAAVFSTYPRALLKRENIPRNLLFNNPWLHAPLLAKWRLGLYNRRLDRLWQRAMDEDQTRYIARHAPSCDVFIGHSGSGLRAGPLVQARGGRWICDRGSSHQLYADRLLSDEYARFGSEFQSAEPWALEKELREYELADRIVVPSEYARRSFVDMGIDPAKLRKIPYGGDLIAFRRVADPDPETFTVFFCGQISFRKGFPYLLDAFHRIKHPRKRLVVAGQPVPEIKPFLAAAKLDDVEFLGTVKREHLSPHYSRAHVFAIASVDEGMAMVQGEAMACGTPVVATDHCGGELIREGVDGYVVKIRDPAMMAERLQRIADDPQWGRQLGASARDHVLSIGGWDGYCDAYVTLLDELIGTPR